MNLNSFKFYAKAKQTVGEIYLYGQIGASWTDEGITAKAFVATLKDLKSKGAKDLCIYISSIGGSVFEGLAIYNAFSRWEGKKTIVVDGLCASIASIIAMAADTIRMSDASLMMIHEPSGVAMGRAKDMEDTKAKLEKIRDSMADVYSSRTGRSVEDVKSMMAKETWFTAKEAVKEKFADETVQSSDDKDEEKAVAFSSELWSTFRHPPTAFYAMIHNPIPERLRPPSEENTMSLEIFARALGLSADASESAILAVILELRGKVVVPDSILALTSKENVAEARGVVLAWKASHERVGDLLAQAQKFEVEARGQKVVLLVEGGVKDGKIPPAMKDFWMTEGNKNLTTLESYIASAPKLVPGTGDGITPKATDPSLTAVVSVSTSDQDKIFQTLGISDPKMKDAIRASVQTQNTELARHGVKLPGAMLS